MTTIIPYSDPRGVAQIAARGGGSLVGSVVSYDPDFVRDVVLGAAPHHGRLLVLDRDCAAESTGHGSADAPDGPRRARAAPAAARSSAGCAPSGTTCNGPGCRARRR